MEAIAMVTAKSHRQIGNPTIESRLHERSLEDEARDEHHTPVGGERGGRRRSHVVVVAAHAHNFPQSTEERDVLVVRVLPMWRIDQLARVLDRLHSDR